MKDINLSFQETQQIANKIYMKETTTRYIINFWKLKINKTWEDLSQAGLNKSNCLKRLLQTEGKWSLIKAVNIVGKGKKCSLLFYIILVGLIIKSI